MVTAHGATYEDPLTPRELEVVKLVAEGHTSDERHEKPAGWLVKVAVHLTRGQPPSFYTDGGRAGEEWLTGSSM